MNVQDAKTNLSRLLARVEAGEEIIITRSDRPVARLVPIDPERLIRQLGEDEGVVTITKEFDAPLPPDTLRTFGGGR
jgi:prevent-host-death family protein